jgi:hypothetical protein
MENPVMMKEVKIIDHRPEREYSPMLWRSYELETYEVR